MTIVEIMKDKERLYNRVPFRRKNQSYFSFLIRWNENYGFEKISSNGEVRHYNFIPEDLLADDWEWVEDYNYAEPVKPEEAPTIIGKE